MTIRIATLSRLVWLHKIYLLMVGTTDDPNAPIFTWSMETASGGHSYLDTTYRSATAQCGSNIDFRDTAAISSVSGTRDVAGTTFDLRWDSAASNYTVSEMVRVTGSDGAVGNDSLIEQ